MTAVKTIGHEAAEDAEAVDRLLARVDLGEAGAAIALIRLVRAGGLSDGAEARVVAALYEVSGQYSNPRLRLAIAGLCERVGRLDRTREILRGLVAAEYPPAWHAYGCLQIEAGRVGAGMTLLRMARESGYEMGETQYWAYQARLARWPRRWLLYLRMWVALAQTRISRKKASADTGEGDAAWLPE